jgi:hypothetical protein
MSETELQRRQVTGTLHSSSVTSQVITKLSTNATQSITQAKVICFTLVIKGVLLLMNVKKNMKYHILGYIYRFKMFERLSFEIGHILAYIVSVIKIGQFWNIFSCHSKLAKFSIYRVFYLKFAKYGIYIVCHSKITKV